MKKQITVWSDGGKSADVYELKTTKENKMTNEETNKLIGKEGTLVIEKAGLRSPGLAINVIITDVRQSFGRIDILCVPVSGTGEKWTNLNKITLREV